MHLSEFPHLFLLQERLDVDIHLVKIFALSLSPSDDDGALFFCNLSIFNCIMDEKFQSFREHSIRTLLRIIIIIYIPGIGGIPGI